jgi:putative NADH-flavin reductase
VLARLVLAAKMRDKDAMQALVCASDVAWTIVRPPALTNGPLTGRYQSGVGLKIGFFASLSRADLAQFLVREAAAGQYIAQAPTVAA